MVVHIRMNEEEGMYHYDKLFFNLWINNVTGYMFGVFTTQTLQTNPNNQWPSASYFY
jgi:hypothetical protein